MPSSLIKLVQQRIALILIVGGLVLIIAANTFHLELLKVQVDHVLAEVGALILIVGTLHWMFEINLRNEMLKDIASTALGSSRIYESGLVDCAIDSKKVSESVLWIASQQLIIGIHYSPRYLEHMHPTLKERCKKRRPTKIYVVKPESQAAEYLKGSQTRITDIQNEIGRIEDLLKDCDPNQEHIELCYHQRILRYNFIYTEQYIWINFLPNSRIKTVFPAFKIQAEAPLFDFFERDIKSFATQEVEAARRK